MTNYHSYNNWMNWDETGHYIVIDISKITYDFQDYRTELTNNAKQIYQDHISDDQSRIGILLSGGIDSETMCNAFLNAEIDVTGFSMRYMHNGESLNEHDIQYAIDYCQKRGVTHEIIDYDIVKWHDEFFLKNYMYYECHCPSTLILSDFMKHVASIGYLPVAGMTVAAVKRVEDERTDRFYFQAGLPTNAGTCNQLRLDNVTGIVNFFGYKPTAWLSYLDQCMKKYTMGVIHSKRYKHEIYDEAFPLERRTVYHGWEHPILDVLYQRRYELVKETHEENYPYEFRIFVSKLFPEYADENGIIDYEDNVDPHVRFI